MTADSETTVAKRTDEEIVEKPPLSPPSIGGVVAMFLFALVLLLGVGYCFGGDAERPEGNSPSPVAVPRPDPIGP